MNRKHTIFLPVHNGGEYVKQCVASVLAQRQDDFDLVVLENGSTDGTCEWLGTLRDPRVSVRPSAGLLTIEQNWSRIRTTPKNEFMTVIGHDDLLDPDYLNVMSGLVRSHPGAGLYLAHFRIIDSQGNKLRSCRPLPARETTAEYLAALFSYRNDIHGSGYFFRSSDYDRVGGMPPWEHLLYADAVLWLMLMERGGKVTAPKECFSIRLHEKSYSHQADTQWGANALEQFHGFLHTMATRDPGVAEVLTAHGPDFFLGAANSMYERLLAGALARNQRVDPAKIAALAAVAKRIVPGRFAEFRGQAGGSTSRRDLLNRFAITRWLYYRYRRLRYGRAS